MNENLDLTKILEGCPQGTEFYHACYDRVWFVGIDLYANHPIRLSTIGGCIADISVTRKGTFSIRYNGECLLFPSKEQRDWSKFERFWDKPKIEKFDVNTLHPFDKILARDKVNDKWDCAIFSHIDNLDSYYPIVTVGTSYKWCIPYNDETKHLCGTTEDCPEYYKWWKNS